jgi:cysteine-rich repeat protein
MKLAAFALALAVPLCAPFAARAQSCSGVNHVTWPATNPVWDFCWQRPSQTSFLQNGAGLRIYDVKYKGVTILRDGSIPVLNVQYNAGGCGGSNLCYRDWFDEEQAFLCAPETPTNSGHCTGTTTPVETVCADPGSDFGSFDGVAVVDHGTSLHLTSQARAGWYRYIPTWEFFADGTLLPGMDITSVDHPCVANTHRHHAYFRLDFDLAGTAGDRVTRTAPGAPQLLTSEQSFTDTGSNRTSWLVESTGTTANVEVHRNAWDGVADSFARADGWLLAYAADEIDDGPHTQSQCPIDLNDYLNGQSVQNADIVLWVHSMALHEGEPGGIAADCSVFGPTIKVNVSTCGDGALDAGEQCDDSNTAAGDCCSATCQYETSGSACSDANVCTAGDVCDGAGACQPGSPVSCSDGLFCNGAEGCNPLSGCEPGAPVDCADALACTGDACDEPTDSCVHAPNDAACADGLYCNGVESCSALTGCQAGVPVDCADAFACTADSCNEAGDACDHAPNDAPCDDGLFCNGVETCAALSGCQAATPVDCADALACTTDGCDELTDACLNVPDDGACDDGLACTADACDAGLGCQHQASCPPGLACGGGGACEPVSFEAPFQAGLGGYAGAQDTYLVEADPNSTHGAEAAVEWDADDPAGSGKDRVGLLRFGAIVGGGPGQVPPGAIVTGATLTLEVFNASVGSPATLHESTVAWDAATVRWNDFGGDPGVQADEIGPSVADAPVVLGTATMDVTASVQGWVADPNSNHGWVVMPTSTNNLHVRSSEYGVAAQRPRLDVEYVDVDCLADADCDDADACSADHCEAFVCSHAPIQNCPPPAIPASSRAGRLAAALLLLALGASLALRPRTRT